MILVTGATGQLGRLVINALLEKTPASNIVAAVRDVSKAADLAAQGVTVRQADYALPATLDAALQGVSKVLLISSNELGQRVQQHQNVIDAAVRAGVALFAYTSVLHADTSPLGLAVEHRATEAALRASGLPYTLLRNGWYTQNYTGNLGAALEHGAILGSAKDGRIAAAGRADYAAAAAVVLTSATKPETVYELAGDEAFTLPQLAAEVARQSGKAVVYKDLPEQEYKGFLISVGLPEGLAALLSDSDVGVSKGALEDGSRTLSSLIGRPTLSLADAVKAGLNNQG